MVVYKQTNHLTNLYYSQVVAKGEQKEAYSVFADSIFDHLPREHALWEEERKLLDFYSTTEDIGVIHALQQ